jgi:hypothetical protein
VLNIRDTASGRRAAARIRATLPMIFVVVIDPRLGAPGHDERFRKLYNRRPGAGAEARVLRLGEIHLTGGSIAFFWG